MTQVQANEQAVRELLRLAETTGQGCPICRSIADANRGFAGVLMSVRLGTLLLRERELILHLRGCTTRDVGGA